MGYRSDLRVITTKEGLKQINDFLKDKIEEIGFNPMDNLFIDKEVKDVAYLGWKRLNVKGTDFIELALYELEEKDISYRYCCIGESLEDITEMEYISDKDEKSHLPYISYIRDFDEKDMEQQLNKYANSIEETIEL